MTWVKAVLMLIFIVLVLFCGWIFITDFELRIMLVLVGILCVFAVFLDAFAETKNKGG